MENDNKDKVCDNCRYFLPHYVKYDNGTFMKLLDGHCTHRSWKLKQSDKIIYKRRTCEHWEPVSIKIEERKKSIFANIEFMERHLSEIAQILKEDCEG